MTRSVAAKESPTSTASTSSAGSPREATFLVVGIDPGLATCGVVCINDSHQVVQAESIGVPNVTKAKRKKLGQTMTDSLELRLKKLAARLSCELDWLCAEDTPMVYICIEGVGKGRTHHHAQLAAGVLRGICYERCDRLFSLTPFEVRHRLDLPARAPKDAVWSSATLSKWAGVGHLQELVINTESKEWDEHMKDAYALAVVGAMCIKEAR